MMNPGELVIALALTAGTFVACWFQQYHVSTALFLSLTWWIYMCEDEITVEVKK